MSHSAIMRVLGTLASACIRCRQRPPVPMRPMLSRSLAPTARADAGKASADAAAVVCRKRRRESEFADMGSSSGRTDKDHLSNDNQRQFFVYAEAHRQWIHRTYVELKLQMRKRPHKFTEAPRIRS